MLTEAAVLREVNAPLTVEEVVLDALGPHDVLVRIEAAGVCHSDYHYMRGELRSLLPVVPGHEGAGVVEEVGSEVQTCRPGDTVCLMWRPRCGNCFYCLTGQPVLCQAGTVQATSGGLLDGVSRLHLADGSRLHHLLGVSCFARHAVVSERSVIPVPPEVPAAIAAIAGCAVITGVGAVLNVIGACAGDGVLIFGAGGVGLSAVMGARLAGAAPIIVVDMVPARLELARGLGATHVIDAGHEDVQEIVTEIAAEGVPWAIDAVGRAGSLGQAFTAVRPGGTVVAVGLGAVDDTFPVPINALVQRQKRVVGSLYGSANPPVDIPRLLEAYLAGRLPLDELVGGRYALADINSAFDALVSGAGGRAIILPGESVPTRRN